MLRIIISLLWDAFLIYVLIKFGSELGGYIFLILGFIAFFTWELIRTIKYFFE